MNSTLMLVCDSLTNVFVLWSSGVCSGKGEVKLTAPVIIIEIIDISHTAIYHQTFIHLNKIHNTNT